MDFPLQHDHVAIFNLTVPLRPLRAKVNDPEAPSEVHPRWYWFETAGLFFRYETHFVP
jgi:hypothetical protein